MGLLAVAAHWARADIGLLILGQEAALGVMFRNRWLNELVGDWLIHFPFSSATHHVRQQVLAHYEFPNDPERDAELVIARRAGFWPLDVGRLLRLSAFIRWNSLRTNYNFEIESEQSLSSIPARPPSKLVLHIGTGYVLVTFALLLSLYFFREKLGRPADSRRADLRTAEPVGLAMVVFSFVPESSFPSRQARQRVFSARR